MFFLGRSTSSTIIYIFKRPLSLSLRTNTPYFPRIWSTPKIQVIGLCMCIFTEVLPSISDFMLLRIIDKISGDYNSLSKPRRNLYCSCHILPHTNHAIIEVNYSNHSERTELSPPRSIWHYKSASWEGLRVHFSAFRWMQFAFPIRMLLRLAMISPR